MPEVPADKSPVGVLDDRVLLRRFVQDADEAAFSEIVRRYQKLVMSVCRRILGSGPDAEDAFQATFVSLARRPRSIRSSNALSSWLYTVAYRTSWRTVRHRKQASTESLETDPVSQTSDPLHEISEAQDCAIVDEELQRLPKKFKDVLVMSYFAKQTNQQIADDLNVSKGTIDGRLRDARNLLRVKLARRGVTIGAIALVAGACSEATAEVSASVLNSTLQLGNQALSSSAVPGTDLSRLNHLVRPETTIMSTKLIATTMLGIFTVGAIGFGSIVTAQQKESQTEGTTLNATINTGDLDKDGQQTGSKTEVVNVVANPNTTEKQIADDGNNDLNVAATLPVTPDTDSSGKTDSDKGQQKFYSAIPSDASPAEKRIYTALEEQASSLRITEGTPLDEILETIRDRLNENSNSNNRIALVVDRDTLRTIGIDSLAEIPIDELSVFRIEWKKALKLILERTAIGYTIRNDVLFITTEQELQNNEKYFSTRVYPVANLLARQDLSGKNGGMGGALFSLPTQVGGMGAGAGTFVVAEPEHPLVELVCEMTSPPHMWLDRDGAGGAIAITGNSLVVRHSIRCHEEVVNLLNLLANADDAPLF